MDRFGSERLGSLAILIILKAFLSSRYCSFPLFPPRCRQFDIRNVYIISKIAMKTKTIPMKLGILTSGI